MQNVNIELTSLNIYLQNSALQVWALLLFKSNTENLVQLLQKHCMKALFLLGLITSFTAKSQVLTLAEIKQAYIRQSDSRDIYLSDKGWKLIGTQEESDGKTLKWAHSYTIGEDSTEQARGWLELHAKSDGKGTYLMYGPMGEYWFNNLRKSALALYGNPKVVSLDIQGTATEYNAGIYRLSFLKTVGKDEEGLPINSFMVFFQKK